MNYQIIRTSKAPIEIDGEMQYEREGGTVKYKTPDTFEDYALFVDKDNAFTQAYQAGDVIRLYDNDGNTIRTYMKVPTVFAGKWDNYNSDDVKRLDKIVEVVSILRNRTAVHVSFDYEGRTRHETAAEIFANALRDMGYADEMNLRFEIGYNYEFKITRKDMESLIK